MSCNKFWLQNPKALFTSIQLVPLTTMDMSEQLNALTRLIVMISILMLIFDFKYAVHFLVISLLFIIILFYIQKRTMENFTQSKYLTQPPTISSGPFATCKNYCQQPSVVKNLNPTDTTRYAKVETCSSNNSNTYTINNASPLFWCNDQVPFQFNNPNYKSPNQKLGEGQNPKTLIKPVVVPPSHDLGFWKANNLIVDSRTNAETQREAYLSGYAVSTCCGNIEGKKVVPIPGPEYQTYIGGL